MSAFAITIPAVRGVQAGREFYLAAVPLRHVPNILRIDADAEGVNKKRVRELVNRILKSPGQYSLPPLVVCVDEVLEFHAAAGAANVGTVRIGMDARVSLNDGADAVSAIAEIVTTNPKLGDETASVVLVPDAGLRRSRQIFADLARNAPRHSSSLTLLYDQRSDDAVLAKAIMRAVPVFSALTETKKSSISNRSTKLFTLSAIHSAMHGLFAGSALDDQKEKVVLGAEFWTEAANRIPAWQSAAEGKIATADLRRDFVHAHALALAAIARAGNQLLARFPRNWKPKLKGLSTIDWSRANILQWEGRAMNAGRLSKRSVNVVLTGNLIKQHLGLELSVEEEALEREYQESRPSRPTSRARR